ncbi:von Willebrand factor type A domain-containing protein [Snodgrassella sp. B3882]|uniref:vWA domain-containing protein n=1 Tax=Snodgrassella sp. B3882 TaxID=2818037 RepID=UPI00226A1AD5|nr:von Willebrand factor type A domain-containing protein [Snodgrassella sp. B3882]MCX8745844.1 von Willebrand factor type A domain-containing protein [Snodgrassella sp. B3882]
MIKSKACLSRYSMLILLITGILSACNSGSSDHNKEVESQNVKQDTLDKSQARAHESEINDSKVALATAPLGPELPQGPIISSPPPGYILDADGSKYKNYSNNSIKQVIAEPVSTFSLDMDTASYAITRSYLSQDRLPQPDAVRVEEFINYFPAATNEQLKPLPGSPFAATYELTPSPWNANKVLLRVNIKAAQTNYDQSPPANLVFLIDTSALMYGEDRLGLIQKSLKYLVDQLRPQDKVSIVKGLGIGDVALEPTSGSNKAKILAAINKLEMDGGIVAGKVDGEVNGEELKMAYKMAERAKVKNGINRILFASYGGNFFHINNHIEELKALISDEKVKGITLSTLGFGMRNLNDELMMQIADVGDGNYSYIDNLKEGQKVLQEEMSATLVTVAKDVKAQIEFNPSQVLEYRQIGYEKRQLKQEDFNNDKVDAGDIGSGKNVTLLYELTLVGAKPSIDPLRYQSQSSKLNVSQNDEIVFLKLRWKAPNGKTSALVSLPIEKTALSSSFERAGTETRFLTAVAAFGQKLRNNPELSQISYEQIADWANHAKGNDPHGYRSEFVALVRKTAELTRNRVIHF